MFFIKIALPFFAYFSAQATQLPTLKAKQSLDNIRFISKDGKYTYYQRRSGNLQVSTNYSNEEVLDGEKHTEYFIHSGAARKKLLIEKDGSFHQKMSHHKLREIYAVDFGEHSAKLIASGVSPRLHQDDQFMSYFTPATKSIRIQRLSGDKKPTQIKLVNKVNDFFIPIVHLPTPNDVIFSDINSKGTQAFLIYSILDKKLDTIYKASYPGSKLESCMVGDKLIVGEFTQSAKSGGAKIFEIPLYNNKDYNNSTILYQTTQPDIGNMVCRGDKLFFIKTSSYNENLNLKKTEVASLDLKTKKVQTLTDLEFVSQIISMDGMILAPYRGKYYIVEGNKNIVDDALKKDKTK
ncbi:MAG: hypothetical protein KC478_07390 [Bacteriovoracaceae bacterium]|nr:hypothetical protein [Bacteriovoracaceae bacterium]